MRFSIRSMTFALAPLALLTSLSAGRVSAQEAQAAFSTATEGTVFYADGNFKQTMQVMELPGLQMATSMFWKGDIAKNYRKLTAAFSPSDDITYLFYSNGMYTKLNRKTNSQATRETARYWTSKLMKQKSKQICAAVNWGNGYSYVFFKDGSYVKLANHDNFRQVSSNDTARYWPVSKDQAKQLTAVRVNHRHGYAFFYLKGGIYIRHDMTKSEPNIVLPTMAMPIVQRIPSFTKYREIVSTIALDPNDTLVSDKNSGTKRLGFRLNAAGIRKSEKKFTRNLGKQVARIKQMVSAQLMQFGSNRFVHIDLRNSKVSAAISNRLNSDTYKKRGYYLEKVQVRIKPTTRGMALVSDGPETKGGTGSTSSTSGVNMEGGVDSSGTGSFSTGVNFSNTYSENLTAFKVVNTTSGTTVKHDYRLSATKAAETWSVTQGGLVVYEAPKDLIRMDAAGQLGGTPLNALPPLAKSNMPLISQAVYALPKGFNGKAKFRVEITVTLRSMEQNNKVFTVQGSTHRHELTLEQSFSIDTAAMGRMSSN